MEKFCLLGKNIGYSLSPIIHNHLFKLAGVNASYEILDTDFDIFDNFVENIKNFAGVNVTTPYKEKAARCINLLEGKALLFGSVNTILVENNIVNKNNCLQNVNLEELKATSNLKNINCGETLQGICLRGYNTDSFGFNACIDELGDKLLSKNVCVLGAGGASRMVAFETALNGGSLTIAVRNLAKAKPLVTELEQKLNVKADMIDINCINRRFDLIVNATNVGTYPNVKNSPLELSAVKNAGAVFDMVYNPQNTKLIQQAKNLNIKCMGGLRMLVLQATQSHKIWYNATFDTADVAKLVTLIEGECV